MPLLDRILPWRGRNERASTEPVPIVADVSERFGPGLSSQPDHETLLRESLGVADMATRAIANRIATLNPEVRITRRVMSGTTKDEILDDHALKRLLERPHPNFSRSQLMRLTTQYIVTVGEAYWLKVGGGFGVPIQLDPVPPAMVTPLVRRNVVESYLIRDANGREAIKPADTMVRFFFPDPESPFQSEGYLGPNAIATDAYKFQTQHLRTHYEKNATPPAWIKAAADAVFPDQTSRERFLTVWQQQYNQRRGSKAGLPAFLPPGFDVVFAALQTGAEITPLLEYFQSQQLMNFGTPASVLGRVISGDRSSAETNQFVFDLHTVKPIADLIADTLTLQLAPDFSPDIFVDFEEFVSDDKEHALKREAQDITLKLKSPNMVLEERGFDPVGWGDLPPGSIGDQPYTGDVMDGGGSDDPGALGDPPEIPEMEDEPTDEEPRLRKHENAKLKAALLQVDYERRYTTPFERAMRGVFENQKRETLRRYRDRPPRARINVEDLLDFRAWATLMRSRVEPLYKAIFERVGQEALTSVAGNQSFLFNERVTQILEREGARLVTRTFETTKRRLARQLAEGTLAGEGVGQIARRLDQVFLSRKRDTRTIARTEVLKASQTAQVEGFTQSGVVQRKRWNTSRDEFVRDQHVPMDGVTVAINEDFNVNGEAAEHPGDARLSAANVINCRCFVTPVIG